MGFFAVAGWQPLSDTGEILANGTLTFSRTGTSTAKNIYSDKALSNALSNPLSLDANGRTSTNIFMLEDEGYRVVLKNSGGTTIWTRDEIFALALAVDERTRRKEIARSPFDHGAVGDGSTNDAVALAAALAAADGVLDLEGKTYRCDSTLPLRSGVKVQNGTIDFSNASISAGLQGAGTAGTASALTGASEGDVLVTPASTAGYTAGDLLRIRSADVLAASHKYAELFRLEQVDGTDLVLDGVVHGEYSTTPFVEEITPISDVRLENLTIIAPSGGYAIDLDLCERVRMRNVSVKCTAAAESIKITSCYGVVLEHCSVRQKTTDEAGGIIIGDASRDVLVTGCHIERALQAIEIGDDYGTHDGLTRDVVVTKCRLVSCGQIEIAAGARFVHIDNNKIECDTAPSAASTAAILVGGADVRVTGNEIRSPEGVAVLVTPLVSSSRIEVSGNWIRNGETHGVHVTNTAFTVETVLINDNEFYGVSGSYVVIDGTAMSVLEICRNKCRQSGGTGVAIDLDTADSLVTFRANDNEIDCSTTYTHGILAETASLAAGSSAEISRNKIYCEKTDLTQIGILTTAAFYDVQINDNWISAVAYATAGPDTGINATSAGSIDASVLRGSLVIARNRVTSVGTTNTGTACIAVAGANVIIEKNSLTTESPSLALGISYDDADEGNVSILGNQIDTAGDGISIAGTASTRYRIVANTVKVAGNTAHCLEIQGGASDLQNVQIISNYFRRANASAETVLIADVNGLTVIGNTLDLGSVGIAISGCTNSIQSDNTFINTTSEITGTFTADTESGFIPIPLSAWRKVASDDIETAANNGGVLGTDTTPAYEYINGATSKAHRIHWVANGVDPIACSVPLPPDLDEASSMVFHMYGDMSGATDTPTVGVAAFFNDGSSGDAGGASSAFGQATADETRTITAGNVPAYPGALSIELTPAAHANNALRIYATWIEYRSMKHKVVV